MPKRQAVLKSVKKDDPLTLNCEWQSCNGVFAEMKTFMDHVSGHLQLLSSADDGQTKDQGNQLLCCWNECNHGPFSELSSLTRHVYFHAFHMKIKSIGMTLIIKNNMQGCLFDSSTRNTIPDIPERFSCGWAHCSAVYDNPELFYLHINNHCDVYPSGNHVPDGCRCQWDGCETVVKSKHKLKDHVRAHTQEKLAACPTCGALFSNMTRLYDHLKRQLESEGESYQCSHCNKRYATERLLKEHMRHHVSHFQCPFCDMTCPNLVNLRLHFQYRHSESRPYKCDQCSHAAKSQNDLRRHQETHKPWIHCEFGCNFRCHSINELKRHNRLKHEHTDGVGKRRFQCHLCSARYMLGTKLTSHLRKKHKFRWPPGHVRFRYKFHSDGYYRLQTVRYESIELTQQILASDITGIANVQSTPTVDDSQTELNQPDSSNTTQQSADVYDAIVIRDNEATKDDEVMYSYNLDLLGDVALQDSAKCHGESEDHTSIGHSSTRLKSDNDETNKKPAKKNNNRKTTANRGKRKRNPSDSVEVTKSNLTVVQKSCRQEEDKQNKQETKDISQSTAIKDVQYVATSDVPAYQPVTEQMIRLPDGQQILVTSDVPVDISVEAKPSSPVKQAISIEQTQAQFEGYMAIEPSTCSQYADCEQFELPTVSPADGAHSISQSSVTEETSCELPASTETVVYEKCDIKQTESDNAMSEVSGGSQNSVADLKSHTLEVYPVVEDVDKSTG